MLRPRADAAYGIAIDVLHLTRDRVDAIDGRPDAVYQRSHLGIPVRFPDRPPDHLRPHERTLVL